MQEQEFYRSHQQLPFIQKEGQAMLKQQKVLIIGAGGLGCPCLLALTGAGIGTIGIADFDKVAISNLHRQSLYQFTDAGKLKTAIAAERLQQYNPFIQINKHVLLVDQGNVLQLIQAYDIIADCTDNFAARYLINDACVYLNKPLVYGAIHQGEGHITVFNHNGSATLRCLFPKDENESIASCAEIGAYNITTSIIGNMMANEVIKIALNLPDILEGKLKLLNVLDGSINTIAYKPTAEGRAKSMDRFTSSKQVDTITPLQLSDMLNAGKHFTLIDVREPAEHANNNIGGINLPLQQVLQTTDFPFTDTDNIIVYCQKGNRSPQALSYLKKKGFANTLSLQGGIDLYQQLIAI